MRQTEHEDTPAHAPLLDRITNCRAVVGVIGLGYVGLPLAVEFARAGYSVIGFDIDQDRVAQVSGGVSPIPDVDEAALRALIVSGRLRATSDFDSLAEVDAVSICVPTPLRKTRDPDVSYVVSACEQIVRRLRRDQLVVLESTTYPGTTEELVRPLLEQSGLRVGSEVYLAFSPERIDPGNRLYTVRNTPKVIGGVTEMCAKHAAALYKNVTGQVVVVSSPMVAEMVKLLENTYRAVNIGLANELAQMTNVLGIDVWEVIAAAATKPFGFTPFYPGPGLGGHCIPVDPHYLSWKLRSLNYRARFIELASEINGEMPRYVVEQITEALNEHRKCVNGAQVLILGVAYKRDVGDVRESPAIDIIDMLHERGAVVTYCDSFVPALTVSNETLSSAKLTDTLLREADCVVILTDHGHVDYARVVRHSRLVVDTRNAVGDLDGADRVWRLNRPAGRAVGRHMGQVRGELLQPE